MQYVLLFTVMWVMFSHILSFSDEIIILNLCFSLSSILTHW